MGYLNRVFLYNVVVTLIVNSYSLAISAQSPTYGKFGDGVNFYAPDSSFSMKTRFRFQTLYIGEYDTKTNDFDDRFLTRRFRLKFDGFAISNDLVYKVELALSNRDQRSGHNPEFGETANIILDAALKWNFANNWSLWFGQTKLPGNRERVISSQNLQFVDRSLVNSRYNLDRDLGIQLHRKSRVGNGIIKQAFSISMGEGRNVITRNPGGGHQITGRIEFLPLGEFTSKGDYSSSDLKREASPKLSIGVTGDLNRNAVRQRGNLGSFNIDASGEYITTDIRTFISDLMFKYKGYSLMSEYVFRNVDDNLSLFGVGEGFVVQGGYLFPRDWEIAMRYTNINGFANSLFLDVEEYTVGFSRYIKGHNLKAQTDLSLQQSPGTSDILIYRIQFEIAI